MAAATKTAAASTTDEAQLPRRLKASLLPVRATLDAGPDFFLASRHVSEEASRRCLASLFSLASSLHSPQLPYYSKSLETSRARHVTPEQVWGQLNMLLRPVLRRLQDNVRRAQKTFSSASYEQQHAGAVRRQTKRRRDEDNDNNEEGGDKDALSTKTSEMSESDLDEEIAQLLAVQQQRRQQAKSGSKGADGDHAWRYAFGKGNEDDDEAEWGGEKDEEDGNDEDDDDDGDNARIRRRHARAMTAAAANGDEDEDDDDDDDGQRGEEELAALREMYGEDFVPEDDDDDGSAAEAGGDEDDDPQLEEDLAWDDPSAPFNERDGQYWGGDDDILADDGTAQHEQQRQQEDDEDDAELNDPSLTELQRERLRERRLVSRLEQERLYNTQWAMAGEASGNSRPRDALLDEA
ncbi:putative U3 small nucleolar ribonucleo protein MPP10, partial [Trypanosoma grayi]|uniref:putative U3 small nucleolar ribonucleo protein MPP10 n=1 Tax=Trypanosoma grayi TaxID=71804 RepID=UPI0004F4541A